MGWADGANDEQWGVRPCPEGWTGRLWMEMGEQRQGHGEPREIRLKEETRGCFAEMGNTWRVCFVVKSFVF